MTSVLAIDAALTNTQPSGVALLQRDDKHDWYPNPATKMSQPVPRHREIADTLAKHIRKMLS